MIIFLYGPDSYRLANHRKELVDRYRAKYTSGLNFIELSATVAGVDEELQNALKAASFFDEIKLIHLREPFSQKSRANLLLDILRDQEAITRRDIVLMVSEARSTKELQGAHRELFELLNTKGNTTTAFEFLTGTNLTQWVQQEAKRQGVALEPTAVATLVEYVGSDTWTISRELQKFVGLGRLVTRTDVAALTSRPPAESAVFALVDAFANHNRPRFQELLYRELHGGSDPYSILTMLTYQARNLVAARDLLERGLSPADLSRTLGVHPFVAKKSFDQAKMKTMELLRSQFQFLVNLEHQTKQGKANLRDELFLLVS